MPPADELGRTQKQLGRLPLLKLADGKLLCANTTRALPLLGLQNQGQTWNFARNCSAMLGAIHFARLKLLKGGIF